MEDFNVLAISLGQGMADVRGCLVLSRDGLVLGAHPAESERATTRAWIRFATIGDPERGFVQFGTETWCYVRRAPYAGFAVAGPEERAGLVIDHMEQVLQAAEERRSRQDGAAGDRGRDRGHSIRADTVSGPRASGAGSSGDRRPGARSSRAPRAGTRPSRRGATSARSRRRSTNRSATTRRRSSEPGATTRRPSKGRPIPSPSSKSTRPSRMPARPGNGRRQSRSPTPSAGPSATHAPTRNRSSNPSTRRTRGRERGRRPTRESSSSPRTRPRRRTTTSTDSRSRGSSAGCFRGAMGLPIVRRPRDRRA